MRKHLSRMISKGFAALALICAMLPLPAFAQIGIEVINRNVQNEPGSGGYLLNFIGRSGLSYDGRYAAFSALDSDLSVSADNNGVWDVFVRVLSAASTELVSASSAGTVGNEASYVSAISRDGKITAFTSSAENLVPQDTNDADDVFVHDRQSGVTSRVSVASNGQQANAPSASPAVSVTGRFVAFESAATNLVGGDTNAKNDIFMRDRTAGTTTRVSVGPNGAQANNFSASPAISSDGRYIAFSSAATNLVGGDVNGVKDIFVYDRQTQLSTRVSVSSVGVQGNGHSAYPVISASGRFVAFESSATNLVPGDTNGKLDVFVHDRDTGVTARASISSAGAEGNAQSHGASISDDGRFVAFQSDAKFLAPNDTNDASDIFVHDRSLSTTQRLTVDGAEGNDDSMSPSISGDGTKLAFFSMATNLVAGVEAGMIYVANLDSCPEDDGKIVPGQCGCGVPDIDSDEDGTPDCSDGCTADPAKTEGGECGCGTPDADIDGNGTLDCQQSISAATKPSAPDVIVVGDNVSVGMQQAAGVNYIVIYRIVEHPKQKVVTANNPLLLSDLPPGHYVVRYRIQGAGFKTKRSKKIHFIVE